MSGNNRRGSRMNHTMEKSKVYTNNALVDDDGEGEKTLKKKKKIRAQ